MVRASFRLFFQILGAMAIFVAATVGAAAYRLSQGPIELDFLTPYIEQALSAQAGAYSVKVFGTEINWGGWRNTLDLKATGVQAFDPQGNAIATVPELYLRLSAKALSQGLIAPRTVEVRSTRVRLHRDETGGIEFGVSEGGGADHDTGGGTFITALVNELLAAPDPLRPTGYLNRVVISDARVTVSDRIVDANWEASRVDLDIQRDDNGIRGDGVMALTTPEGLAEIELVAAFDRTSQKLDLGATFAGLRPSSIAAIIPPLRDVEGIELPIGGTVTATLSKSGMVESVGFDLTGGKGTLALPAPIGQTHEVERVVLRGQTANHFDTVTIHAAEIDFGTPVLTMDGSISGLEGGPVKATLNARATDVPADDLPSYWPDLASPPTKAWVVENIADGYVPEANVAIELEGPSLDDLGIVSLTGSADARDVTVGYIAGMPRVRGVDAILTFSPDRVLIEARGGSVAGLKPKTARIDLYDLDQPMQYADIRLHVDAGLRDALTFIDNEPLGFASALGVVPDTTSGQASVTAALRFPLLQALELKDIEVTAEADIVEGTVRQAVLGKDVTNADLSLIVDQHGLTAEGEAMLADVPARVTWTEDFRADAAVPTRFRVNGVFDRAARKAFGLDFQPLAPPILAGPIKGELTVTIDQVGRGAVGAQLDFQDAALSLPALDWSKPEGEPATGSLSVRFSKSGLQDIPGFSLTTADGKMAINGAVRMNPERTAIDSIVLDRFHLGRTDLTGVFRYRDDGTRYVEVTGNAFDASPFFATNASGRMVPVTSDASDIPPLELHMEVERVWIAEDRFIGNVIADVARDNSTWHSLNLIADIADGQPLRIGITPFEGARDFSMTSDDAGAFLRTFGFYDNMLDGALDVQGTMDSAGIVTGTATINDFRVVGAPVLARLLTVASLTGVFDLLQGEGIRFTRFELPFTYADGLMTTKEGRAWGPALGITVNGHADIEQRSFDLDGVVVPSYTLNSLLGNIPLLGRLFTGEKGGGLIGMNYSIEGTVERPVVTVNPLSALTPGFLRNIFGLFDTSPDPDKLMREKTKDAPTDPAAPPPVTAPAN